MTILAHALQNFPARIRFRTLAVYLIVTFGAAPILPPPVQAGEIPEPGAYHYSVTHSLFGRIGRQTIELSQLGRDIVVTMEARVKIRVLFMTLLRLHTRSREVWRDGRLVAFEGQSEEDGETITIAGKTLATGVFIDGPHGRTNVIGPVALTNPWTRAVLDAAIVVEPTSGSLLSIRTKAEGDHWIDVSGHTIKTRKFVVSGEMEADVWFAEDGTLSRMEFFKAGGRVTIALESFARSTALPGGLLAEDLH